MTPTTPLARARAFLSRPRLGKLSPYQRRDDGTIASYLRYCWWPLRLGFVWSKGQQWRPWVKDRHGARPRFFGRFGWEVTSHVLGDWRDHPHRDRDDFYTGSQQRPHIFGRTTMVGPLRIMQGPRTGWHSLSKRELLEKLRQTDASLSTIREQRDEALTHLRQAERDLEATRIYVGQLEQESKHAIAELARLRPLVDPAQLDALLSYSPGGGVPSTAPTALPSHTLRVDYLKVVKRVEGGDGE